MISHIHSVPIVVSNQDSALKFYRDVLGFEVTQDSPNPNGIRWLTVKPKGGQTNIMLTTDDPNAAAYRLAHLFAKWTGMVLTTGDIRAECARLKSLGARITREPEKQHWGGIEAQFSDPDGNTFELVQG